MGHSLCSFILRQIPRRSPTHNAVYFTTTRLGGYKKRKIHFYCLHYCLQEKGAVPTLGTALFLIFNSEPLDSISCCKS